MVNADDESRRRRVLGRLRLYLERRRSPRAILSGIMLATALTGFGASMGMLKLGFTEMWLRYPLAVLAAWGVFLALVRLWAESERATIHMAEEVAGLGEKDGWTPDERRPVLQEKTRREGRSGSGWLDWMDPLEILGVEMEGCLVLGVIVAVVVVFAGTIVAITGVILQAEVLLAEVLLDTVLVSALYHRLRKQEPEWWLHGVLRQTAWPVLATMASLVILAVLFQHFAPEAQSIGDVWRHWHPAAPQ
jgi:hypothetical protein